MVSKRRRHESARAALGKRLRSQREKALRYARRLEEQGYAESARQVRETASSIRAGRGRSYGEEARRAAEETASMMSRARDALASLRRFNREAASARRGMASPLTQGLGFTDLHQFPRQTRTELQKKVSKKGRVTFKSVTREFRSDAAKERFRIMESYFYRSYRSEGLAAGPGQVLGWMGAEGLYPGSKDRLGSIVMGTEASSAFQAWSNFWHDPEQETALRIIDLIAVEMATQGYISDETLDWAYDEGVLESSPQKAMQQVYDNVRG